MFRGASVVGIVALLVALAPTPASGQAGCQHDMQCKGDRICVAGRCVSPGGGGAATAPAKQEPATLAKAAKAEYKAKRYDAAARLWAQYVTAKPRDVRGWGALTLSLYNGGHYKEGVEAGRRCVEVATEDKRRAACLYNLGLCFESLGQRGDARRAWEMSIALRPNKTVARKLAALGGTPAASGAPVATAAAAAAAYVQGACPGAGIGRSGNAWSVSGRGCHIGLVYAVTGSFTAPGRAEALLIVEDTRLSHAEGNGYGELIRFEGGRWLHVGRLDGMAPDEGEVSFPGVFQDASGRDAPVLCSGICNQGCCVGDCSAVWLSHSGRTVRTRAESLFATADLSAFDDENYVAARATDFRWEDRDGDGRSETLRVRYHHQEVRAGRRTKDRMHKLRFEVKKGRVVPKTKVPKIDAGC